MKKPKKSASKQSVAAKTPAPKKVQVRLRQDVYVSKREQASLQGLVSHIGTHWEPTMGTVSEHLTPTQRKYVEDYAADYYEKNPDHPYHPKRRATFLAEQQAFIAKPSAYDPDDDDEEEDDLVARKLTADIDAYNKAHPL